MTTAPVGTLTVRDGRPDDAPAIARVHVAGWQSRYVGLIPQDVLDGLRPEQREARWRMWLDGGDRRTLFVALDGDRVVGFSAGWPEPGPDAAPDTIEVAAIYVDDTYHGRGLGRRLLARVASRGQALGFIALSLEMLVGNPTAGFYEHLGGRISDRYASTIAGHQIPEVQYRWDDIGVLASHDRDLS